MGLMDNKYMMIGAAAAGVAVVYLAYKGAGKVVEAAGDVAQAINPLNNQNVINQGFESVYRTLTGSTASPGSDFYDATHGGALDITSDQNFIYKSAAGAVDTAAWGAGQIAELLDPRNLAKQLEDYFK